MNHLQVKREKIIVYQWPWLIRKTRGCFYLFAITFLAIGQTFSQNPDCSIEVRGQVFDKSTRAPLSYATISIEEINQTILCDTLGKFKLTDLCSGTYHLSFQHISCDRERIFLLIDQDTSIRVYLTHHEDLLDEVQIHDTREANTSQNSQSLTQEVISLQANENLGNLVEQITGVSTIKTGTGISKPVIHGLYGNRISILNNGIAQAGQQWGNDHAPEIDPMVADHISVIKGVSTLAYQGSSLGGILLVEPGQISRDPHLHGRLNYIFETNGKGHTANLALEQSHPRLAWKTTGTFKRVGDRHTPDYFLTNSGVQENNFSLQLEKDFSDRWQNKLYYSLFHTRIGILRGTHIGNLTDLRSAIERTGAPFFTRDTFSYQIQAPSQNVQHHFLKLSSKYLLDDDQFLTFNYGGQINHREEFDVRRGGRTEIPSLSLLQISNYIEGTYSRYFDRDITLKTGLQYQFIDNVNNPETGIFPLIPDYTSSVASSFLILNQQREKIFYEGGFRYDYVRFDVVTFARTFPRVIERFANNFHNPSVSAGFRYQPHQSFKTNFNVGFSSRNPAINELYSFGLHQGVSGIEEGDPNLIPENSLKAVASVDWNTKSGFHLQVLGYLQQIEDFIYLEPQREFRLTIRGAFPVFSYVQTNAQIIGVDATAFYEVGEFLKFTAKYEYTRGHDLESDLPLIYIPPGQFRGSISMAKENFLGMDEWTFEVEYLFTAEQRRFAEEQDFLPPPPAYHLLNGSLTSRKSLGHLDLKFFVNGQNLLNTSYRNYLNRQRYFADEMGRNIAMGISISF